MYIGFNESACIYVDDVIVQMTEMRTVVGEHITEPTGMIVPVLGLMVSTVLLVVGARIFRVSAAIAAAGFAFCVVYSFIRDSGAADVNCNARIISASIVAAIAAISAGCVYKAGLFLIGAAAFAASVHMIFASFPQLHDIGNTPTMSDKSLVYWGLMLLAAIAGGLLLRWNSKPVLEFVTSAVGGAGIAYSLYRITSLADFYVERWIFMIVGMGSTIVGTLLQRHIRLHGCKMRKNREIPRDVRVTRT